MTDRPVYQHGTLEGRGWALAWLIRPGSQGDMYVVRLPFRMRSDSRGRIIERHPSRKAATAAMLAWARRQ